MMILSNSTNHLFRSFTLDELQKAINKCKTGRAAGIDDIRVEQIKRFGAVTKMWMLMFYNNCLQNCNMPKVWRKARVIAILKPGRDPEVPRSYRVCHLFKILERVILNRLTDAIEPLLISQQAGFTSLEAKVTDRVTTSEITLFALVSNCEK